MGDGAPGFGGDPRDAAGGAVGVLDRGRQDPGRAIQRALPDEACQVERFGAP